MFNKLIDYVKDNKTKIILLKDKIDICNYKEVLIFEEEKILINCYDFKIEILGNNLVINRLFNKEVLITGDLISINYRGLND